MELRFRVNQAEAFRRGISVPKSIVRLDVYPGDLDQETRNLIADRMDGIDVCKGEYNQKLQRVVPAIAYTDDPYKPEPKPVHIEANVDTLEALLEAVRSDEVRLEADKLLLAPV